MKVKVKFLDPYIMFFRDEGRGVVVEGPFKMHEDILASEASHIIYTIMWQSP